MTFVVPSFTGVTTPSALTVTMFFFLTFSALHLNSAPSSTSPTAFVAVALSAFVSARLSMIVPVSDSSTFAAFAGSYTVTFTLSLFLPIFTVIFAVPAFTGVTTPPDTFAIFLSDVDHVSCVSSAPSGCTFTLSVSLLPSGSITVPLSASSTAVGLTAAL